MKAKKKENCSGVAFYFGNWSIPRTTPRGICVCPKVKVFHVFLFRILDPWPLVSCEKYQEEREGVWRKVSYQSGLRFSSERRQDQGEQRESCARPKRSEREIRGLGKRQLSLMPRSFLPIIIWIFSKWRPNTCRKCKNLLVKFSLSEIKNLLQEKGLS